ncbi:hypothetical protein ACJMK2_017947 [Sinanodonta woodiana]|uniref:CUB domain-containing protein n=1 Tax=Sinanodonta woodiana TaxID=1069815 RepID=A0ABD3UBW9_SINWO
MLYPPASPLSPLTFTGVVGAVQGIAFLSILSVIVQEIINKRKQRPCGEPPSNIGDFVLIGKQGDAAFYECPGMAVFQHDLTQTCPIIYCQNDGNFSTPVFQPDVNMCVFPAVKYEVIQSTSGEITSPNYPSNYNPSSTSSLTIWNIMVPGKDLKFKVEDFDIDQSTQVILRCGLGSLLWVEENQATIIGLEYYCNKPCAQLVLLQGTGVGGKGFKISFTSVKS